MTRSLSGPVAVAALAAGALLGAGVAVAALPLAGLLLLAAAAALLLTAPRAALWAFALVLFAVVPLSALPLPGVFLTISPPMLVLLAVAVRRLLDGPGPPSAELRPVAVLLLGYAAWLAVTALASDHRHVTVGWLVSYGGLVVLPALLATTEPQVRDVLRCTWAALGGVLGLYALVETFLLKANPVLGLLGQEVDQRWSVYRATTTLGHPVSNGGFFAVAVPLALGLAVQRRSKLAAAAAVLAAGGVVASGTRSAFLAMLIGAAVAVLFPVAGRSTGRTQAVARTVGMVAIGAVLLVGWAYLAVRSTSGEGQRSAAFRSTQVPIALESVQDAPVLGTGPGAASFTHEPLLARIGGAGAFESHWLELVVGAGLPGLLLGIAVVLAAVTSALRSGAPDVAGAVLAWAAAATFVNSLEGGRPELLVLGLVLAMAFSRPDQDCVETGSGHRGRGSIASSGALARPVATAAASPASGRGR